MNSLHTFRRNVKDSLWISGGCEKSRGGKADEIGAVDAGDDKRIARCEIRRWYEEGGRIKGRSNDRYFRDIDSCRLAKRTFHAAIIKFFPFKGEMVPKWLDRERIFLIFQLLGPKFIHCLFFKSPTFQTLQIYIRHKIFANVYSLAMINRQNRQNTGRKRNDERRTEEQSELSRVVIHLSRLGWPESLNALPATGILA